MAYQTFERTAVRVEDPTVSLTADGRIALNAAASRLLEKAGARAVRILWDKATCGIALQVAQKGDKNAFSVSFKNKSHTITAKRFLKYIGWTSDRRQTFEARWNAQQKMLEAELPPRLLKTREDKSKPGLIPPVPDPFGGNDSNRRAAERMAKDRSTTADQGPAKLLGEGTG